MERRKSIAIVTDGRENGTVAKTIDENIRSVFVDHVQLNSYYINELKEGDCISDDVVLVMLENRLSKVKPFVKDPKNIIVVQRTISERGIYRLFEIPEGTRVLVVNDCMDTTVQTISLLYQLGVTSLNLMPYDEEEKSDPSIKIAITPGERERVPGHIEKVIDVSHRCLDAYTFIRIMNMLELDNKKIGTRFIRYLNEVVDLDNGIKKQYKDVHVKSEQLSKVLHQSNEGILIVDKSYHIQYHNRKFSELIGVGEIKNETYLGELLDPDTLSFLKKDRLEQELLNLNAESIVITRSPIEYFGEKSGYYFNFHSVTYIKQLEQNLSRQLKKTGLIARYTFEDIIFQSEKMRKCIEMAKKISDTDLTILITGESGTGKELMAQSIHNESGRENHPFVAINCAALPETLLESELFGYEGGAFTGARKDGKLGVFEQAHLGTIFLDEIGDMPLPLQARLLRVLQEKQIMRIGSDKVVDVDVRIITATNRDLKQMVEAGKFREDLYYRIKVLPLRLPPLRERREDILLIFETFLEKDYQELTDEMKTHLKRYGWPGNIREMKNVADYFKILKNLDETLFYDTSSESEKDDSDFFAVTGRLNAVASTDEVKAVLDALSEFTGQGMGRQRILNVMENANIPLKESRLRRILRIMSDEGLIKSNIGRHGSEITDLGEVYVKWIKNRS